MGGSSTHGSARHDRLRRQPDGRAGHRSQSGQPRRLQRPRRRSGWGGTAAVPGRHRAGLGLRRARGPRRPTAARRPRHCGSPGEGRPRRPGASGPDRSDPGAGCRATAGRGLGQQHGAGCPDPHARPRQRRPDRPGLRRPPALPAAGRRRGRGPGCFGVEPLARLVGSGAGRHPGRDGAGRRPGPTRRLRPGYGRGRRHQWRERVQPDRAPARPRALPGWPPTSRPVLSGRPLLDRSFRRGARPASRRGHRHRCR
jgi:hypothetical protein